MLQPLPRHPTRCRLLGTLSASASTLPLPLFSNKVPAGFPSPGDDAIDQRLDLNELVVRHPAATFFVRVEGESMIGAGIHPDDILVVDRALEPAPGKVVVCALDGELIVKRLKAIEADRLILGSENPAYPDIEVSGAAELVVWGVVTHVIHRP
ncbi:MAG TPA: translesion error-prone DNA polymerase V autoproteolytic subunit [Methylothermaceae bacterium]|nr:translesion error-prone DNA polymerase V autoproteolytic subunit [Methylothermaceae bacterium]